MQSCWLNRGCSTSKGLQEPHALSSHRPLGGPPAAGPPEAALSCPAHSPGRGRILPPTHHHSVLALLEPSPAPPAAASGFCLLLLIKKPEKKEKWYLSTNKKQTPISPSLPCNRRQIIYMLAETERQLHAPHFPNNSAGCHLSPVLHDDQSSPALAAHKFTSVDNVLCKREREGGKERE